MTHSQNYLKQFTNSSAVSSDVLLPSPGFQTETISIGSHLSNLPYPNFAVVLSSSVVLSFLVETPSDWGSVQPFNCFAVVPFNHSHSVRV